MPKTSTEVTRLLQLWSSGDRDALDQLFPIILDEIKDLARRALKLESASHTLQPTALVNEAYVRLIGRETYWWKDRRQFFAILAELMRRILVDHARRQRAAKRGGGQAPLPLEESLLPAVGKGTDIIALDDALDALKAIDRRRYDIVMLWFFMGLTQKEIAEELGISINTVGRQWQAAKRWLKQEMQKHSETDDDTEPDASADDPESKG